jgi:hypothetical protein
MNGVDVMIQEHDLVALTRNIESHRLQSGDVGTVVHCYENNSAYEVEFVTAEGTTIAVLTLASVDIKPFSGTQILHIRELTTV